MLLGSSARWSRFSTRRPRVRLRLKSCRAWSKPFRVDASASTSTSASASSRRAVCTNTCSPSRRPRRPPSARATRRSYACGTSTSSKTRSTRRCGSDTGAPNASISSDPAARPASMVSQKPKDAEDDHVSSRARRVRAVKPVRVPDSVASMLKMRRVGDERHGHAER